MTLKICGAQLNFIVGDLPGNAQKIIAAANEAYARNPQWVTDNVAAVGKIKAQLPSFTTTVDNPFYVLDTQPEHAILFAPRNQAALANTLLGIVGALAAPHVPGFGWLDAMPKQAIAFSISFAALWLLPVLVAKAGPAFASLIDRVLGRSRAGRSGEE